jgi:hypothetical protein
MIKQVVTGIAVVLGPLAAAGVGCGTEGGSTAQSGKAPGPVNGVYSVQLETNGPLPTCNPKTAGETAIATTTGTLASCVLGVWVPVPCVVGGAVAFDSATDSLWACTESANGNSPAWMQITLPQGPKGDAGAQGPQGPVGEAGTPGAPGESVTSTGLDAGDPHCPFGGAAFTSASGVTYVCNGAPGASASSGGVGPCAVDADCDDGNACTVDFCGAGQCAHSLAPSGTVCRASNGACDATELCTGSSTVCPPDLYFASGVSCSAPVGPCDLGATCSGKSTECPPPALKASGTLCSAATACGLAAYCDGVTPGCTQSPVAVGTVCRAGSGCLASAVCDGTNLTCPDSSVEAAGTACAGSSAQCGMGGTCDGTSSGCQVTGLACQAGDSQLCTCGPFTGFSGCDSSSCTFDGCRAPSGFGPVRLPDPSVQFFCGSVLSGQMTSSGCSQGQLYAEWAEQVPGGDFNAETIAFGSVLSVQYILNGSLISGPTTWSCNDQAQCTSTQALTIPPGCNSLEILLFQDPPAGSSTSYAALETLLQ